MSLDPSLIEILTNKNKLQFFSLEIRYPVYHTHDAYTGERRSETITIGQTNCRVILGGKLPNRSPWKSKNKKTENKFYIINYLVYHRCDMSADKSRWKETVS